MDIRVESLVSAIHDCREQYKHKLDALRQDFLK
jgi:hypothetical protein